MESPDTMSTYVKIKTFSQHVKYDQSKQQEFGMLKDHVRSQGKLKAGPKEKVKGRRAGEEEADSETEMGTYMSGQDYFKPDLQCPLKYENFTPIKMFQVSIIEVHCGKLFILLSALSPFDYK